MSVATVALGSFLGRKKPSATGLKSCAVVLMPFGAEFVPSSVFAPTMVGTRMYAPSGRARWMEVRVKSPSMD